MTTNTIETELDGNLLIIRLNRPDNMNAFTIEMGEELIELLDAADKNDDVRAIIFTGNGRAFCAGMDLSSEGNVFGLDESVDANSPDMEKKPGSGRCLDPADVPHEKTNDRRD